MRSGTSTPRAILSRALGGPAIASAAVFLAMALSPPSSASAADRLQLEEARALGRGRAIAQAHCSMCHAVLESGRSPQVLAPPFRDLSNNYAVGDVIDAIAQGARTGHPAMPRFNFTFEQGQDLIRYVRSLQTRRPAPELRPG